jgi:hypothetical protein
MTGEDVGRGEERVQQNFCVYLVWFMTSNELFYKLNSNEKCQNSAEGNWRRESCERGKGELSIHCPAASPWCRAEDRILGFLLSWTASPFSSIESWNRHKVGSKEIDLRDKICRANCQTISMCHFQTLSKMFIYRWKIQGKEENPAALGEVN